MSKSPRIAGLILCKRMEVNPAAVEMSLVGVFHSLTFPAFPAHAPFMVYAEVYDALAEGTMELAVMRLENEEVVYSHKRWFAASDRGLTFRQEWRVRKCVFPVPGRYALSLRLDDLELTKRYLDVKEEVQ